jgi:hypothetical protein
MNWKCTTYQDSDVNNGTKESFALESKAGNFSLHHCVQTDSGAHPASYPMSTSGSFPGGKAAVA